MGEENNNKNQLLGDAHTDAEDKESEKGGYQQLHHRENKKDCRLDYIPSLYAADVVLAAHYSHRERI